MSPKKHEIAWHKKQGKFISPSLLKPHQLDQENEKKQNSANRRQEFMKKLSATVKKGINPSQ